MSRPEYSPETLRRREAMSLLARCSVARLAQLLPDLPPHEILRMPEIGTVMIKGRAGGTGSPFNLGETTVTRASLRLPSGEVGHGYVQGRDKAHALRAAAIDALGQRDPAGIESRVLSPLRHEQDARKAAIAAEATATRVEFFTLARGEDQ
ncbi:phosphonate C-P lyase system protein PhnG [Paracoccus sp. MBLB3053]|uniref:Phosphonate C-P lyase system protein PhnG n=1 Tax=Paracoccus aurantius TaxID=3073814 RepID=A0ABU2HWN6_9RHOB|nr:phosphonate C-P lyase system protein PhnG [Paracoccus sp. MBLB3053]MDS9468945.1 phosphonate C-P lyase system protein PhnG [Paracoccus sp. MBLB3053]